MIAHNIPSCYRKIKEILFKSPDLALLSTLIGSNYPCLELIYMVPKVFEPLKFDCIKHYQTMWTKQVQYLHFLYARLKNGHIMLYPPASVRL